MTTRIEETLLPGRRAPLCMSLMRGPESLSDFVAANRSPLLQKLADHGAILFRGFEVRDASLFSMFISATGGRCIDYRFRSTPRSLVTKQIYTSTEYPSNREIALHSENAYYRTWPLRLAFCCIRPAAEGGETPLADLRDVTRRLGPRLIERFESAKIRYIRHYHRGIDLSWEHVFQTSDPMELRRLCLENDIQHEWIGPPGRLLRTAHTCQGVSYHPLTSERVFFNQAHLFHATALGESVAKMLRETFGADRIPRHSTYGDHSEIPSFDIFQIQSAFRENATILPWECGDVLWIDNMQVAHGRRPYKGERRVLAALMDSSDESPLDAQQYMPED